MPAVKPPAYPKLLTVDGWNKTKGLIARIKKIKTGVTEELIKAKKEFDAVKWENLEFGKMVPDGEILTPEFGKEFKRQWQEKNYPTFKKLQATYAELSTFLKQKANEFAKDKDMVKFVDGLKKMADEANKFTYAVAWGTVAADQLKNLELIIGNAAKAKVIRDNVIAKLKENVNKSHAAALKAKNDAQNPKTIMTPSQYIPFLGQHLRSIGANVKLAASQIPAVPKQQLLLFVQSVAVVWAGESIPEPKDMKKRLEQDFDRVDSVKAITDTL